MNVYLAEIVLVVESVNVCYQRVPRLAKLLAVLAVVPRLVEMFALNVVVQVGRLRLEVTVRALPQAASKPHHLCTDLLIQI